MGAKHNIPSLENAMMDSPDLEHFDGVGVGVVVVVGGKLFLIVLVRFSTDQLTEVC